MLSDLRQQRSRQLHGSCQRGARHLPAPNFAAQVVVSERLITGQNPASARGVAEALVRALIVE